MPESQANLVEYIERIPSPDEIKQRLSENLREVKLLRQLLRISEQRQRVEEAAAQ